MPSKKKRFNARFPPARIKKIMQKDDEVGKVAQVVPYLISKALESFAEQLLISSAEVTHSRNARTLTPNHIKSVITNKKEFQFLSLLAQSIPDVSNAVEEDNSRITSISSGATICSNSVSTHHNGENISLIPSSSMSTIQNRKYNQNASDSDTCDYSAPRLRGRPKKRLIDDSSNLLDETSTLIHPNKKKCKNGETRMRKSNRNFESDADDCDDGVDESDGDDTSDIDENESDEIVENNIDTTSYENDQNMYRSEITSWTNLKQSTLHLDSKEDDDYDDDY